MEDGRAVEIGRGGGIEEGGGRGGVGGDAWSVKKLLYHISLYDGPLSCPYAIHPLGGKVLACVWWSFRCSC